MRKYCEKILDVRGKRPNLISAVRFNKTLSRKVNFCFCHRVSFTITQISEAFVVSTINIPKKWKFVLQVPAAPLAVAVPPAVEWIPGGILVPSSHRPLGPQGSTRGHRTTVAVVSSSAVHRIASRAIIRRNSNSNIVRANVTISRVSRQPAEACAAATVSPRPRPLRARRRASATWTR